MTSNAKNPLRKEDDPRAMDRSRSGINLLPAGFLLVVCQESSWSIAVSLLRHRILTLVFVSVFTAPGIRRSAPDAGGSTSSAPTPQVFAPGVFSG